MLGQFFSEFQFPIEVTYGEAAILWGAHACVAVVGEGLGDVGPRPGELLGQGLHCCRVLH